MTVVSFPVLTLDKIVPRDWETVLRLPLPARPGLNLLEKARGQMLLYLDEIMHSMIQIDSIHIVHREIHRVTERLLEISAAMQTHSEFLARHPENAELVCRIKWNDQRNGSSEERQLLVTLHDESK
jgi:hypothetical protein